MKMNLENKRRKIVKLPAVVLVFGIIITISAH